MVLRNLGLPTGFPAGLDRQSVLQALRLDKKKADGKVRFVLPLRIGEVRWGVDVREVEKAIHQFAGLDLVRSTGSSVG
jgi:3-dehydroquinate synthetase